MHVKEDARTLQTGRPVCFQLQWHPVYGWAYGIELLTREDGYRQALCLVVRHSVLKT